MRKTIIETFYEISMRGVMSIEGLQIKIGKNNYKI